MIRTLAIENYRDTDPARADPVLAVLRLLPDRRAGPGAAQPDRHPHPVLGPDGADVASALQTICEIGNATALEVAVDLAFPGSRIGLEWDSHGRIDLRLHQHGLLRPLGVAELSDGTLRYLLWVAALLTPRPPGLLVLNEPETSLHSDLLAPLAQLISMAADDSQIIVVSHSRALVDALGRAARNGGAEVNAIELEKEFGETGVVGQDVLDQPAWHWPKRLRGGLGSRRVRPA